MRAGLLTQHPSFRAPCIISPKAELSDGEQERESDKQNSIPNLPVAESHHHAHI